MRSSTASLARRCATSPRTPRRAPSRDRHAPTLTVADDGRGFDAAQRADRAEQGHVGLSLLGDLVAQAGGTLTVDSTPGHGTTVTLEVPR